MDLKDRNCTKRKIPFNPKLIQVGSRVENYSIISMGHFLWERKIVLQLKSQKVEPIDMGNNLLGEQLRSNQVTDSRDRLDFRIAMKP